MSMILILDQQGNPLHWGTHEDSITYHAKNLVAWQLGETNHIAYRGGENRITGQTSRIETAPIVAVRGESYAHKRSKTPALTNQALFARDQFTCAYCGHTFHSSKLTRDHIVPVSRGGEDKWTNVVTACQYDNNKKDDKLLSETGMQLLFLPYVPNRAEALILKSRKILPVQANYLSNFIPKSSRAHQFIKQINELYVNS
jgi:5-methylcytosine-specific restriction endonuclease McrA